MTRAAMVVLALTATFVSPAATPTDDTKDLWLRAVQTTSQARNVIATTIVATFHGQDPDTGVACRREATLTLREITAKGALEWDVVNTEDLLGRVPEGGVNCQYGPAARNELQVSFECTPLNSWMQDDVTYVRTDERREVEGTACVVHDFTWKRSCLGRKTASGQVCIDPATALPLEIRYAFLKPPKGYRSVDFTMFYEDLGALGPNVVSFAVDSMPKSRKKGAEPFRFTGRLSGHRRVTPE